MGSQGLGLGLTGQQLGFSSPSTALQGHRECWDFGFQENDWNQNEEKQHCGLETAVEVLRRRRAANSHGRVVDRTLSMPWADELEYTNHSLCLQHEDFGHQCSTMFALRGQLLDASPVGNNCFVRTLVAAISAFTTMFAAFAELDYEAGRSYLYQIALSAQKGDVCQGYPMSFVDKMVCFTGAGASEDQHIPDDIVVLLYEFVPHITFGIVTSPYNSSTFGAVLSVSFYGACVRDGTLLSGNTLVRDVVWMFANEGHFQALTLQGNLEVCSCTPTFSLEFGHACDVIVMDCTILGAGSPWSNSETPPPSPSLLKATAPTAPQMPLTAMHTSVTNSDCIEEKNIHTSSSCISSSYAATASAPALASATALPPSASARTVAQTATVQQNFIQASQHNMSSSSVIPTCPVAPIQLKTGGTSPSMVDMLVQTPPALTPPAVLSTPACKNSIRSDQTGVPGARPPSSYVSAPHQAKTPSSALSNMPAPAFQTTAQSPQTDAVLPKHTATILHISASDSDPERVFENTLGLFNPPPYVQLSTETAVSAYDRGSFAALLATKSPIQLASKSPTQVAAKQQANSSAIAYIIPDAPPQISAIYKGPQMLQTETRALAAPSRGKFLATSNVLQDVPYNSYNTPSMFKAQETTSPLRIQEQSYVLTSPSCSLAQDIEGLLIRKLRQHQMEQGNQQQQHRTLHLDEQFLLWQQQESQKLERQYWEERKKYRR